VRLPACIETTKTVMAGRRLAAANERQRQQFEQAPGFVIVMSGPAHIVEFVNNTHRRVFASDDWVGKAIREAFPSLEGQGFFELLDRVYASGKPVQRKMPRCAIVALQTPPKNRAI
jgi:hypothetical protein